MTMVTWIKQPLFVLQNPLTGVTIFCGIKVGMNCLTTVHMKSGAQT